MKWSHGWSQIKVFSEWLPNRIHFNKTKIDDIQKLGVSNGFLSSLSRSKAKEKIWFVYRKVLYIGTLNIFMLHKIYFHIISSQNIFFNFKKACLRIFRSFTKAILTQLQLMTAASQLNSTANLPTFLLLQPDWTRIAKSPISWGTSWRRIVKVVITPRLRLTRNEAPMARPSVKLWVKSAARFK